MKNKIIKIGNPQLRLISSPVQFGTYNSVPETITAMYEVMEKLGGVGIAAPQIGISKRIIMLKIHNNERYPEAPNIPLTVLINPTWKPVSQGTDEAYEGCLSLGELRGPVSRYAEIEYFGLNQDGERVTGVAKGFHARVIQHEVDHLDGILFIDRVLDISKLGFRSELIDAGII